MDKLAEPCNPWDAFNHKTLTWIYCPRNCNWFHFLWLHQKTPNGTWSLPGPLQFQSTTTLTPQFPPTAAGSCEQLCRTKEIFHYSRGVRGAGKAMPLVSNRDILERMSSDSNSVLFPKHMTIFCFVESHPRTVYVVHVVSFSYEVLKESLETKKIPQINYLLLLYYALCKRNLL